MTYSAEKAIYKVNGNNKGNKVKYMLIKALEKKKEKLRIEVDGETHTLLNLLRENAWKTGAKQAAYIIKHPYLSRPEMIIRAKNPGKVLNDAIQLIINNTKEFEREFGRALKR